MKKNKKIIIFFTIVFLSSVFVFEAIALGMMETVILPIIKNIFKINTISLTQIINNIEKTYWISYFVSIFLVGSFKILAVYLSVRLTFLENDILKKDSLFLKKVFSIIVLSFYLLQNLISIPSSFGFAIAPITIATLSIWSLNYAFKKNKM